MFSVKYNNIIYMNSVISIGLNDTNIEIANNGRLISAVEFADSGTATTKFEAIITKFEAGDIYFDLDVLLATS